MQIGELKTVKNLQAIQSRESAHIQVSDFEIAKGMLIAEIESGMMIRSFNQQVTPNGNGATAGLQKVAKAQTTELNLGKSLNGRRKHDGPILATLVRDITDGTAQNKRDLKAVSVLSKRCQGHTKIKRKYSGNSRLSNGIHLSGTFIG